MIQVNFSKIMRDNRNGQYSEEQDFIEWGLLALITDSGVVTDSEVNADGDHVFDMDFKINGVSVDPTDMFVRLNKHRNEQIAKHAKEQFEQVYRDAEDALHDATDAYLRKLELKPEDIEATK